MDRRPRIHHAGNMPRTPVSQSRPPFACGLLPPGSRVGLAVSGGADSVALLRLAHVLAPAQGWVLSVLHVDHGLRGEASTGDAAFVRALAARLALPCSVHQANLQSKTAPSNLEEAGRLARYSWFAQLLQSGALDAIATGHTLDDQAETVLARLLRGAWTAGLAGIRPTVRAAELPGAANAGAAGLVVRPLLAARRDALRAWLTALGQPWREDASNEDLRFNRNRIRHRALPVLTECHPAAAEHLAQTAEVALDEERYWQAELDRLLPSLVLPGRAVRGGGRAVSTLPGERSVAVETARLTALPVATQRRVLRELAARLGEPLDFAATARVLALLSSRVASTTRREELSQRCRIERTARELRILVSDERSHSTAPEAVSIPVPGSGEGFGVRLRLAYPAVTQLPAATLRAAQPSDRVRLRYSSGAPKRIKEILERMGVSPDRRAAWPVLAWQGELVWVRGAQLELSPEASALSITSEDLDSQPGTGTPRCTD